MPIFPWSARCLLQVFWEYQGLRIPHYWENQCNLHICSDWFPIIFSGVVLFVHWLFLQLFNRITMLPSSEVIQSSLCFYHDLHYSCFRLKSFFRFITMGGYWCWWLKVRSIKWAFWINIFLCFRTVLGGFGFIRSSSEYCLKYGWFPLRQELLCDWWIW